MSGGPGCCALAGCLPLITDLAAGASLSVQRESEGTAHIELNTEFHLAYSMYGHRWSGVICRFGVLRGRLGGHSQRCLNSMHALQVGPWRDNAKALALIGSTGVENKRVIVRGVMDLDTVVWLHIQKPNDTASRAGMRESSVVPSGSKRFQAGSEPMVPHVRQMMCSCTTKATEACELLEFDAESIVQRLVAHHCVGRCGCVHARSYQSKPKREI